MSLEPKEREIVDGLLRRGVLRTMERLEKLCGGKWGIMSSSVREVQPVRLLQAFSRGKEDCVGSYFQSSSMVPLEFLITFSTQGAAALAKAVIKPFAARMKETPDLLSLTVGEVSNYLAQSVLTVIADEFNVMIILKPPEVLVGPKAQLLARSFSRYDGRKDTLLISQVDIYSERLSADCSMVVIVNSELFRKLLSTLQKGR
ncbi:MAG: hypothetical protein HYZ75_04180 [Elusimicrobia bacterium]|nr:hypothetical protein [Elusimicrobiota bacterium]